MSVTVKRQLYRYFGTIASVDVCRYTYLQMEEHKPMTIILSRELKLRAERAIARILNGEADLEHFEASNLDEDKLRKIIRQAMDLEPLSPEEQESLDSL